VAGKKIPSRTVPAVTPAAQAFIDHGHATPTLPVVTAPQGARGPAPSPPKGPSSRTLVTRVDGRALRRLQLYFDAEVAKKLKHHCVEHEVDMSKFVNDVVAQALGERAR
jgi:hypothetical protein